MPNDPSSFASIRGLSQADVEARLKTEGYNELPRPDRRTPLRIILEVVREPIAGAAAPTRPRSPLVGRPARLVVLRC